MPRQGHFGSLPPVSKSGDQPRFGASSVRSLGGTSGQPHGFGSFGAQRTGDGQRFGLAGTEAQGRGSSEAGFHTTAGGAHKSPSGRSFAYHGRTYTRFAAGRYHGPRGYAYHRYEIGRRLPRAYFVRDYYIDNYAAYDLDPPPTDFEWVRYGPDIFLVDLDSGEIAQVVYGAFDEDGPPPDDAPSDSQY